MAKIARTPFNAARWLTKEVSSSSAIGQKLTGYCLFVTAGSAVNLNVDYLSKGSYMKIILKENSSGALSISFPSMEGVLISDNGDGVVVLSAGENGQTTLNLPPNASTGSYVDLICDGEKWYVTGMAHGVNWQQQ